VRTNAIDYVQSIAFQAPHREGMEQEINTKQPANTRLSFAFPALKGKAEIIVPSDFLFFFFFHFSLLQVMLDQ